MAEEVVKPEIRKKAVEIARLLRQGYGIPQTAKMMRLTYHGLLRITKTVEYKMIAQEEAEAASKSLDHIRADIRSIREELNEEMENAVPEAWCVLIDNLRQRKDLRAALEILDRDPQKQFSKSGSLTQVGVSVNIDSQALAQAIHEADRTHQLIDQAAKLKPGEA